MLRSPHLFDAAHACAVHNVNIFVGVCAGFGLVGLAIGLVGMFAPDHVLVRFARFPSRSQPTIDEIENALGIGAPTELRS